MSKSMVAGVLLAALYLSATPVVAQSVCGNAVRETGEQCDDGNTANLDGCSATCKFEQIQRANSMAFQFGTDTTCTVNRFGAAFGSTAQAPLNQSLTDGVNNGSVSLMFVMQGLDDLSGASDPDVQVGVINATPVTNPNLTYNGANDVEWWYLADASSIDPSRVPLSNVSGSIAGSVLTTAPGSVSLRLPIMGTVATLAMSAFRTVASVGTSSAPSVNAAAFTPGHVPYEHLDPALTSYQTTTQGKACGDIRSASLAAVPIPASLTGSGCTENYPASASMLDVLVGGCHVLGGFITAVIPTQPDRSDPAQPVAGAGAPYHLFADATTKAVNLCRDVNNTVVDLNTCLNAAAYSSYYRFTTDRVIVKPASAVAPIVPAALAVDPTGNGVLEPGESATVRPSWLNQLDGGPSLGVTSSATSGTLTIAAASGDYGTIDDGAAKGCTTCFTVTAAANRPSQHWDEHFTESPAVSGRVVDPKEWTVHIGNSFTDVATSNVFYGNIESLLHYGVTAGCGTALYCPSSLVPREQMAAFVARSIAGGDANVPTSGTIEGQSYSCGANGTSYFTDVAASSPFCKHVHYIYNLQVTAGCDVAKYCPATDTSRGQMASFIARALLQPAGDGAIPVSYTNPANSRSYNCGDSQPNHFIDVADTSTVCRAVHYLWAREVVGGFADGTYRPANSVTREQMAKFLANAFQLALYK